MISRRSCFPKRNSPYSAGPLRQLGFPSAWLLEKPPWAWGWALGVSIKFRLSGGVTSTCVHR